MKIQMPADYDKYIYHFTTSEKALMHILPQMKLKMSSVLNVNDPKESKTFGFWSIFDSDNDLLNIDTREHFKTFLRNKCKLTCFSSDYIITSNNTDWRIHGFNHPTMWTHYSDNHKGVCLVLSKKRFKDDNVIDSNYEFNHVDYTQTFKYPKMDLGAWQSNGDQYFKEYIHQNLRDLFFTKYFHWQNEDECRLFHIGDSDFCNIDNSLVGIYLGYDFDMSLNGLLKKVIPENVWIEKIYVDHGKIYPKSINAEDINL